MASNLHLSALLISLFFFFHLSSARFYANADDDLIHTVCKNSTDNQFCIETFEHDPRTAAADLSGLCLISISLIIEQATETSQKLPGLIDKATDHMTSVCLYYSEYSYEDALLKFHEANTSALAKSYRDVLVKVGQGLNNCTSCDANFAKNGLTSPITAETNMLRKLVELPSLVINHIH